jgi:RNA polymerase sigma factor (sigma-70 family)
MNCHRFAAKKSVTFPRLAAFIDEMQELDDNALLREYVEHHSEAAFAELVARHVDKVYSTAWRHTRNPHQAGEITQAVFVILAQKAGKFGGGVVLSGWLYQTARLTAVTLLRGEIRRARREQEALMQMFQNENESDHWRHIAPLLDDALARLGEKDRHAVVLRFFDGKSFGEVGAALGGSEDAAKMRVSRALEKLRKFFAKRGVTLTAAAIAGAVSTNSVHAAPVGLAATITATALKGSTVAASTLTLVKGTMKTMTWMKIKFAIGVGAIALLAGGAATMAISQTSNGNKLTAQEIFQKAQDAYAALSSYGDEGKTVATVNGRTLTTTFTIKLARPNLYRIEWKQEVFPGYANEGSVWSAGNGNFLKMGNGAAHDEESRESALGGATGISGGAAATIPGTFFKMNWGNQLGGSIADKKQQPDEKVGNVDCYVFTSELKGTTTTLWIGKKDFLIHQMRHVTSAEAVKAAMEQAAKVTGVSHKVAPQGITSIETHENISVNQKFSPSDFAP